MNGVVVIDKPPGRTSHDVVVDVRRALGIRRIGHAGTLDPSATGILPVCIGEATKLVPFFEGHRKDYRATMRLGIRTDTLDLEGRILSEKEATTEPSEIVSVLKGFVGSITQVPPRYSALKYHGRPLYDWARKGIDIEPTPRIVEIFDLGIELIALPEVTFRVSCSKGTYVRSLCADVGEKLGCGACLSGLRRIASGPFTEASALMLEGVPLEQRRQRLSDHMIRMVDALCDMPEMVADEAFKTKVKTGHQPVLEMLKGMDIPFLHKGDMIKITDYGRNLVAVVKTLYASEQLPSMTERTQVLEILRVFSENV